jgi:hypothetical protein
MEQRNGAVPVDSGFRNRILANLPLAAVLAFCFVLRVVNLDYNGPFIDESFHSIVIAYGNVGYLTGEVFLYPLVSHTVHALSGLVGARFLSAVFGTLTVGCVYKLAEIVARRIVPTGEEAIVAFAAALVFGVSSPALFTSQFANYYAMSFLLFGLGLWSTAHGLERNRPAWLALGAVILVASYATRYLLLGYLPLALLYVVIHGRGARERRPVTRAFWLPLALAFLGYSLWNRDHILAAVAHAQASGTGLALDPTLELRLLVLREAAGRLAPAFLLATVGLVAAGARALRGGARRRTRLLDLAWLAAGSIAMVAYHVAYAHDLTMESNLTIAALFAAILAGLGLQPLVRRFAGPRRRVLGALLGAAALAAALVHARAIVAESQVWPDWRPVVAAARARGADSGVRVWSTADNGGMRNTWGIRRAYAPMSGNVWQLRTALGEGVDIHSPWYAVQTPVLLSRAQREEVAFVIGPMPFRRLGIGDRVYGYVVSDIVAVPHGPEVHILRNAKLPQ